MIAGALDQIVQSRTLAAEHQHQVTGQVELVVVGCAAFVESDDPEATMVNTASGNTEDP